MSNDAVQGTKNRSAWALPVGIVLLVGGAVGAWLLPNHEVTTFTGVLIAAAVAGLVLLLSVAWRRRGSH